MGHIWEKEAGAEGKDAKLYMVIKNTKQEIGPKIFSAPGVPHPTPNLAVSFPLPGVLGGRQDLGARSKNSRFSFSGPPAIELYGWTERQTDRHRMNPAVPSSC